MSDRYSSGMQTILRQCPRPILTVPPGEVRPLTHALLAYGGNRTTAKEALFVAAYLAAQHQIKLAVVSVGNEEQTHAALTFARNYLRTIAVKAAFFAVEGVVEQVILETAVTTQADFLIMGSFAYSPLRTLLKGSTANRVLLESDRPVLICR
jgi:nucleotide-binding universal stress UspA family protein